MVRAREIVDAKNAVFGRMGSYVAKQLLNGKEIIIINSEETIISGDGKLPVEKTKQLRAMGRGGSLKGPKISKLSDRLLKRKIRGMLPWDRTRGKDAYKRLRCYIGVGPLKEEELKDVKTFNHKIPNKYIKLKEISERI